MRRSKWCIILAACALASASPASANWTTNGPGTFTTSAAAVRWSFMNTSGTTSSFACSSSIGGPGALNGPSLANGLIGTFSPGSFSCPVAGINETIVCTQAPISATIYFAPTTSGALSISCHFAGGACGNATTFAGARTLVGTVPFTYGNTSQQLTVSSTGQNVSAPGPATTCNFIHFPATVTITNSSGTNLSYGVTSTFKPNVTN
jgi:hypothetical protein